MRPARPVRPCSMLPGLWGDRPESVQSASGGMPRSAVGATLAADALDTLDDVFATLRAVRRAGEVPCDRV